VEAVRPRQGDPIVKIDVSPGEVVDRITILEIKLERLTDLAQRRRVETEYASICDTHNASLGACEQVAALRAKLKEVNTSLWRIEDLLREHEGRNDFGREFVELARSVYLHNDRRSALKRQINECLGSAVTEEKSYTSY
jgi:hypothetical protein